MFESVKNILQEALQPDCEITMESRIKEDLRADSLDVLDMLMTIEEEHGVTIPDEALASFETVGDIVRYLDTLNK